MPTKALGNWACGLPNSNSAPILSAPSNAQQWLMLYIYQLTISRDWYRVRSYECSQILNRVNSDALWLSTQLASLSHDYPELEPVLKIDNPVATMINLGPDHPFYHDDSDDELFNPDYRYDNSYLCMGVNPSYYNMSVLFTLANLKCLSTNVIPSISWPAKTDSDLYTLL
jgi:hypothetical protein